MHNSIYAQLKTCANSFTRNTFIATPCEDVKGQQYDEKIWFKKQTKQKQYGQKGEKTDLLHAKSSPFKLRHVTKYQTETLNYYI